MDQYTIITDGSCDLSLKDVEELGVRVVPFYIAFEEENYLKENEEIDVRDFYQKLVDHPNVFPKTSMPTAEDYYRAYEKAYCDNKAILCLTITKKFSGSMNSALTAKDLFLEKYPDATIEVDDTMVNTVLQGLVVREAVRMQKAGLDLHQATSELNRIKTSGRIYFTVSTLSYLEHGGRIGKLSALIGNVLKINPLIILKDGEIQSGGIALSRKRALLKTIDELKKTVKEQGIDLKDYQIAVGYGYDREEALEYKKKIEEVFHIQIPYLEQIGATIAVHTGPYPLGLGFVKKYDR